MKIIQTELILPADLVTLPLAQNYVQQLSQLAGLSEIECNDLVLAIEEAFTNSIEHSFDSGESGILTLKGEVTPQAICISVGDNGLPFDQSVAPIFRPPADIDSAQPNLKGLGLELMQRAVDEVRWVNLGSRGKELRLIKYLRPGDVFTPHIEARHDPEIKSSAGHCVVRRMRADDALRVCQCFYRTFGYSYDEDLYCPDRLISLNQTGEFISVVAADEDSDDIVGHVALVRSKDALVGELTHLVVSPDYRGQGLRGRMGNFLLNELNKLGMVGIYGRAVTTHTISQQASEARDMRVCGINPGLCRHFRFKGIRSSCGTGRDRPEPGNNNPDRESLVYYFKYLVRAPETILYAPGRHQEILARIYEHLQVPAEFRESKEQPSRRGLVNICYTKEEALGEIRVERVGADSVAEVCRARHDLCEIGGAEAVYLDLPLAQAGTAELCRAAEDDGFIFSGVKPSFGSDGDLLTLVYLGVPLDLEKIQVFSPFGRELLSYIGKQMEERRNGTSC